MARFGMALAAMVLLAAPAQAQTINPALDADVRCAMTGLLLAAAPEVNPQQQQAGMLVAIYYLGRINGRAPDFDLEGAIVALAPTLTVEQLQSESRRCGTEFVAVGQSLTELGNRIQERERGAGSPSAQ